MNLAWVFFRADSLNDALFVFKNLVVLNNETILFTEIYGFKEGWLLLANILILILYDSYKYLHPDKTNNALSMIPLGISLTAFYMLLADVLTYVLQGNVGANQFVYFQF